MPKADDMGRPRFLSNASPGLKAFTAVVVFGAAVWLLGFRLLWGDHGSEGRAANETPLAGDPVAVDRPAPDFTQPLISRLGSLSLARYQGKVIVVNFWAVYCAACRWEVPELERLWRGYGGRGVQFLGVDYEDGPSAAMSFARSHGMSYPSVLDPNGTVGDAYKILGLPTTYIIGPNNHIRYVVIGKINVASFRVALESLLRTKASEVSG